MSNMDKYTKHIAEQVRKEGGYVAEAAPQEQAAEKDSAEDAEKK